MIFSDITSIITTISGLIISLTVILSVFKKFRLWLINKLISDVKFDDLDSKSELYNIRENIENHDKVVDEKLDELNNKIDNKIEYVSEIINKREDSVYEIRRSLLRLEIGRLLDHDPYNRDNILKLYDEYKSMGGNSYMKYSIDRWLKEYGNK